MVRLRLGGLEAALILTLKQAPEGLLLHGVLDPLQQCLTQGLHPNPLLPSGFEGVAGQLGTLVKWEISGVPVQNGEALLPKGFRALFEVHRGQGRRARFGPWGVAVQQVLWCRHQAVPFQRFAGLLEGLTLHREPIGCGLHDLLVFPAVDRSLQNGRHCFALSGERAAGEVRDQWLTGWRSAGALILWPLTCMNGPLNLALERRQDKDLRLPSVPALELVHGSF
ncbi:hypothetical protein [Deinococcus sp. UYEF24]